MGFNHPFGGAFLPSTCQELVLVPPPQVTVATARLAATARHGRHGPPGEEGEAKAAEAEALETAGQTRQRLGKKYVKSMGIYGDIHVDI